MVSNYLFNFIMLNIYLNKFNYYNNLNLKLKTPISNKLVITKLQKNYKKLKINFFLITKQKINKIKITKIAKFNFCVNLFFIKNSAQGIILLNNFYIYKNNLIYKNYCDFFNFYTNVNLLNLNFRNYWLLNIFCFIKKTNEFYFINKIKFFLNQRLIKQSVLIHYTNIKKIPYNNSIKFFKYSLLKNKNLIFFFKLNNFYYENNFHNKNYFFKYNFYLKKFINKNNLILMLI